MLKILIDNLLSDDSYFVPSTLLRIGSREAINTFEPLRDYPVFSLPSTIHFANQKQEFRSINRGLNYFLFFV
jgi:hypothetical protein